MNALLIGLKHVKTTAAGVAAILAGLGMLSPEFGKIASGDFGAVDFAVVKAAVASMVIGVGLIFAKDADKSNAATPTATPNKV